MTALLKPCGAKRDAVSIYLLLPTPVLLLCVCPLFPPTFISSVMEDCNWIKSDSARRRTCCGCTVPSNRPGRTSGAVAFVSCSVPCGAGLWVGLTSSHVLPLALHQVNVIHSLPLLPCRIHLPAPVWHLGHATTSFKILILVPIFKPNQTNASSASARLWRLRYLIS